MASRVVITVVAHARSALASLATVSASLARLAATSAMKAAPSMALLAGKIAVIGSVALMATGVVGNLLGAIQLAAPAAIAAGSAMAVLKMSLSGVSEALSAGIEGDTEKFNKALSKLPFEAKRAVMTLVDLQREWRRTQQVVQNNFFKGFREDVIPLSRALQPVADRWLPKIADSFARARTEVMKLLTEAAKSGQLDTIMGGVTRFIDGLLKSLTPLTQAFLEVADVASGSFGDIGDDIDGAAQKFADWIHQMKESGKLQEWRDKAIKTFGQIKDIAVNLGKTIGAIFGASSDSGANSMESMVKWSKDLSDWANSSEGQGVISFWSSLLGFMSKISPVLKIVLDYMTAMGVFWRLVWDDMKMRFQVAVGWILGGWEKVLRAAATAADAMGMDSLAGKLRNAADSVAGFRDDVNRSLDGIKKNVDITVNYHARLLGDHRQRRDSFSGDYLGGGGFATGGLPRGLAVVGENGPEIADFGATGRVWNNGASRRMMAQSQSAPQPVNIYVSPGHGHSGNPMVGMMLDLLNSGALKLTVQSNRVVPA